MPLPFSPRTVAMVLALPPSSPPLPATLAAKPVRRTAYYATRGKARVVYECSTCRVEGVIYSEDDFGNVYCKACTRIGYESDEAHFLRKLPYS